MSHTPRKGTGRTHGFEATYQAGCRGRNGCDACREAHRRYRATREGRDPDAPFQARGPKHLTSRIDDIRRRRANRSTVREPVDQEKLLELLYTG